MTDSLNEFVTSLFPADYAQDESVKIAGQLEDLSIEQLTELAGYAPMQKEALGGCISSMGDDENSWLSQFEGSPLYAAAIALLEQELEAEAKHLQKRVERRRNDDFEAEWNERDQLRLQKKRLELALHKQKAGAGNDVTGMSEAPKSETPQAIAGPSGAGMMAQKSASLAAAAGTLGWLPGGLGAMADARKGKAGQAFARGALGAVGGQLAGGIAGAGIGAGVGGTVGGARGAETGMVAGAIVGALTGGGAGAHYLSAKTREKSKKSSIDKGAVSAQWIAKHYVSGAKNLAKMQGKTPTKATFNVPHITRELERSMASRGRKATSKQMRRVVRGTRAEILKKSSMDKAAISNKLILSARLPTTQRTYQNLLGQSVGKSHRRAVVGQVASSIRARRGGRLKQLVHNVKNLKPAYRQGMAAAMKDARRLPPKAIGRVGTSPVVPRPGVPRRLG
jgi:hypothetical protein